MFVVFLWESTAIYGLDQFGLVRHCEHSFVLRRQRAMSRAGVARSQEFVKRAGSREQVTSVERALSILELLASRNHGLSISKISRAANVPKSSTSYLLRTLVGRGYLRRDVETGQHTLGIRVLSLGGQAMQGMALRELAMPHLRQIVETTRLGSRRPVFADGAAFDLGRIEPRVFIRMDT